MIHLNEWNVGQNYNYGKDIEPLFSHNDFTEYAMDDDSFSFGKSFVVVEDEDEHVLSFVTDGYTAVHGLNMKLIWKG